MHTTDLGGHSGCQILLCETEENLVFVRKISSNIEYNQRLIKQAEKQSLFNTPSIKTPKVLDRGYTKDGLFYFDMEYVQGITLAEYLKRIEVGKVRGLVEQIVNGINSLIGTEKGEFSERVFQNKIDSLEKKLSTDDNKIVSKALYMLRKHSWNQFNKTMCHGDLTLENIIVKDGQLYFIDFLDSFYDCWIMDISTLLQDVQTLWAYRNDENMDINTSLRVLIFRDILVDEVQDKFGINIVEVYYALLLKLIRIYPYTKDEKTYMFLNQKTQSVMNIIMEESK